LFYHNDVGSYGGTLISASDEKSERAPPGGFASIAEDFFQAPRNETGTAHCHHNAVRRPSAARWCAADQAACSIDATADAE
jgi:hypothetical protein